MNPTRRFAKLFWGNITSSGRVNELKLSIGLYFMDGIASGIKKGLEMLPVGLGLMKTGRLNPMGLFSAHGIKGKGDLHKMLKKAREIEDKRKGFAA
jgi:quinone-modifying oxidoreductase subunit QmoC